MACCSIPQSVHDVDHRQWWVYWDDCRCCSIPQSVHDVDHRQWWVYWDDCRHAFLIHLKHVQLVLSPEIKRALASHECLHCVESPRIFLPYVALCYLVDTLANPDVFETLVLQVESTCYLGIVVHSEIGHKNARLSCISMKLLPRP